MLLPAVSAIYFIAVSSALSDKSGTGEIIDSRKLCSFDVWGSVEDKIMKFIRFLYLLFRDKMQERYKSGPQIEDEQA